MHKTVRIFFVFFVNFERLKASFSDDLPTFEILWAPDVVIVGESHEILLKFGPQLNQSATVSFIENQLNLISWSPKTITINPNSSQSNFIIKIDALKAGSVEVTGKLAPENLINDFNLFFKIGIGNSRALIIVSLIVGWIYFFAWSVNSYPQVWLNYKRKSVIGLSFDFLAHNMFGHIVYTIFNICFYFVKFFQDEYFVRFPHGQPSVLLNDVFASTHGVLVYVLIILQCCMYQRGTQRVSNTTWSIIGGYLVTIIAIAVLCTIGKLHWLDFLYVLSYIKLASTLTKYIPQAVLNYHRKSTVGWSIENILFDLTGGVLSILQMFINSYNYDDWISTFGNPAKLCLGLFSIFFDVIFITQHYCLYSSSRKSENKDSEQTDRSVK
ncbi:hypothetical protein ACKWTF_015966 [Chironomus riparius]